MTEYQIGRLWLHLPSGGAGVSDIVGPGGRAGTRPDAARVGGAEKLFEGLDPMRNSTTVGPVFDLRYEPPGFDNHGFDWAQRSTSDVQAEAERRGWEVITRRVAAQTLTGLGYLVPPRRDEEGRPHFHVVLWSDQVDELTWHVPEQLEGSRIVYQRCAFVRRKSTAP